MPTNYTPAQAEADVIAYFNATPTLPNTIGKDGILPDGRSVEVKSWITSGPSLGTMLDGETIAEAVKRLVVADIYVFVVSDRSGMWWWIMTPQEATEWFIANGTIEAQASSRKRRPHLRYKSKPKR